MKTFSVGLVVLLTIFIISKVNSDDNVVCHNLNERCTEDVDCCTHNCRRSLNFFTKYCKEPIPIIELVKVIMGPIGDSAVQSIGPVKKVMVYTKETFALIRQSIVKIVSSTKNIFSPTVQDWECTYLLDWKVQNGKRIGGVHKRNSVRSYLPQGSPSYHQVELRYKNASVIVSMYYILTSTLGDTLFLSEEEANKLDIINEGIVPCQVIIPWTGLVEQYLVRYLYIIPVVGFSLGLIWILNLC